MIKKALFEDELIHGMQRELQAHDTKQGMENLVKAADYLQSAVEIFEEAGLTSKADQILEILSKIAIRYDSRAKEMPAINIPKLMEHGMQEGDLQNLLTDPIARARINTAYRKMGYLDKEIKAVLGEKGYMSEEDARDMLDPQWTGHRFQEWMKNPEGPLDPANPTDSEKFQQNLSRWMKNPKAPVDPANPQEGEDEEITFQSIAQELGVDDNNAIVPKPRKPKDPTKVSDRHTKGLTPDRMVDNLKDHGTMFNLSDDGNADVAQPKSFEEDYQKWKRMQHEKNEKKPKVVKVIDDLPIFVDEDEADDNNVDHHQPMSFNEDYRNWLRMKGELPEEAPPTERMPKAKKRPDFGDLEGLIVMDDAEADDILDADIEDKPLVVHEHGASQTFEDSD